MNSEFERALQMLLQTTRLSDEHREVLTDFIVRIVSGAPAAIAVQNKSLLFAQFNADDDMAIAMLRRATALYEGFVESTDAGARFPCLPGRALAYVGGAR